MDDVNISGPFLNIFQMLYDGILYAYEFLRSIKVSGNVSLLSISIAVVLIGTFLPMIIGLTSTGYRASRSYSSNQKRRAQIRADRKQAIEDRKNARRGG